jgi:hypothetical protein
MAKIIESDANIAHIISDKNDFWSGLFKPSHERYGFGSLPRGETMQIDLTQIGSSRAKLVNNIHSYGQRTGKKFKTKKNDDTLNVMRIL